MVMRPFQQDQANLVDHENLVVLLDLVHPIRNLFLSKISEQNFYHVYTFSPFSPGGP